MLKKIILYSFLSLILLCGCSSSKDIVEEKSNEIEKDNSVSIDLRIPESIIDATINFYSKDRMDILEAVSNILSEYDEIYYYDFSDNHVIIHTSVMQDNVNIGLQTNVSELLVYDYVKQKVIMHHDLSYLKGEISSASYINETLYFALIEPSEEYEITIYKLYDDNLAEIVNYKVEEPMYFAMQNINIKEYENTPYVAVTFTDNEKVKTQIIRLEEEYSIVQDIEKANFVNIKSTTNENIFIDIFREDGKYIGVYSKDGYLEMKNPGVDSDFAIIKDYILITRVEEVGGSEVYLLEIYDFNMNLIDSRRIANYTSSFFGNATDKIFMYGDTNYMLELDEDNKIKLSTIMVDDIELNGKVFYQINNDVIFMDLINSNSHKDTASYLGVYNLIR